MYGMVNQGIRTFISDNHGPEMWAAICADAGISTDEFESTHVYDDAVTYSLVGSISKCLELDPTTVLEVFGKYWTDFAVETPIGKLIHFGGDNLVDVLDNLDDLHSRVNMSMPDLRPPSFDLEDVAENTYLLHYYSDREGLAPMVIGLVHGLADQFNQKVDVKQVDCRSKGADHDTFELVIHEPSND